VQADARQTLGASKNNLRTRERWELPWNAHATGLMTTATDRIAGGSLFHRQGEWIKLHACSPGVATGINHGTQLGSAFNTEIAKSVAEFSATNDCHQKAHEYRPHGGGLSSRWEIGFLTLHRSVNTINVSRVRMIGVLVAHDAIAGVDSIS
jgi:hypothetical protein